MELDNNRKVEIIIGLFLLGGIITWLVIPMSFQDTTIILESGNSGGNSTGAVTSVNATSPIVSSGGTTPNISCPTCVVDSETWILLANVSATNGATSLATANFTSYKYYHIQMKVITQSGVSAWNMRFSGDSGNNYSTRHCISFGSCTSATSTNSITLALSLGSGVTLFDFFCSQTGNILHQKLCFGNGLENDNPPEGYENYSMWSNVTNELVSVSIQRTSGTGTLTTASNLEVFGHN